jgi:malate dehydrogenase (oxaloacetate-decarboxylating)(NADP+)
VVQGIVYEGRQQGRITPEKAEFMRPAGAAGLAASCASLADAVRVIRPTALVGAAAVRGSFTRAVIEALVRGVEADEGAGTRPIVLALSNPDDSAECTAEEAYAFSGGQAVFASGTAFPPFQTPDGRLYMAGQANNSFIFPGSCH